MERALGSSIDLDEIRKYVNENIDNFHNRRLEIISELTLQRLTSKNPYLLRVKNLTKASDVIEQTLEAFLSSSEEKQFGDFLEELAIFIASKYIGGRKSTAPGMDLEFEMNGTYYVVSIKSGSNWGNSSQHAKLASDFLRAERTLRQSAHVKNVIKILGICYGKTKTTITREGYFKIVGQNFWTLISGDKELYIEIIEPLGFRAREHNERYYLERNKISNLLTQKFIDRFCLEDGSINWTELVRANSQNYDLEKFDGLI